MVSFDAMILAAGFGKRLRPYTDTMPKALVELGGMSLLERTVARLDAAGARRIVVNVHHLADQIRDRIEQMTRVRTRGSELIVSREDERPLETGGGILRAAELFGGTDPILVHNVDVVTGIDLADLVRAHTEADAGATLAVSDRDSSRKLWFDEAGLSGRDYGSGRTETVAGKGDPGETSLREMAFAGIQVVSPELVSELGDYAGTIESEAFSIIDAYMWLAGKGRKILPYDATGALWLEIGTPDRLARARHTLESVAGHEARPSD